MTPEAFFPSHTAMAALPNSQTPRLYFPCDSPFWRWRFSALYPAFRPAAKAYRLALRLKAACFYNPIAHSDAPWLIADFAQQALPEVKTAVILLGTPGPAQKLTIQLWDDHRVVGYLKYAETPAAKRRLENEHQLLQTLAPGLGTAVLNYGPLFNGLALLTEAIRGTAAAPNFALLKKLMLWREPFQAAPALYIEDHPFLKSLADSSIKTWAMQQLAEKTWPCAVQHGDFVPWNIVRQGKTFKLIDWEYGTLLGFPLLDDCHYLLQVAALIYRWSPQKAKKQCLSRLLHLQPRLQPHEAEALLRLSAYATYVQQEQDGISPEASLQCWRKTFWQEP